MFLKGFRIWTIFVKKDGSTLVKQNSISYSTNNFSVHATGDRDP
jgi:hypothetical protein